MTSEPGFTHLHVHSHYTLLGATASIAELVDRAAAEGLTHLALTDANALYGAVAFDRACRQAGIEPILGMWATVSAPSDIGHSGSPLEPTTAHLLFLAANPEGYRSLCRLSSLLQASPDRETRLARGLSWPDLRAHNQGLLCLGGGRSGWTQRYLRAGDTEAARAYAAGLAELYGDRAYLSLELHQESDRAIAQEMMALGRQVGLKPVAAQPIYCLSPDHTPRFRLLAAIDHNLPLEQVPASALPASGDPNVELHWLPAQEVAARFEGLSPAIDRVREVIGRCGPVLPDGRPIWPNLELPEGQTPDDALRDLAERGLEDIYAAPGSASAQVAPHIRQRLGAELDAIAGHGYSPLFLVVAGIVDFARRTGVPVNTRGSVANSLVAYCSGITSVDPIAHDLLFERFLNPARSDLPDIDLDFCSRRRDKVLNYVRQTFGAEHVALVATVSTLRPRGAVRETAKAYGLSESQTKHLISLLPRRWHPDPRRRDRRTMADVLDQVQEPRQRQVVRAAYELVGQPHHLSVHPGGTVVTPGPLTDVLPLQWAPKGFVITQFDHGDVESVGLPKLDLLGIRALTVLADAERLVQEHHDPTFSLQSIPEDDAATAAALSQGQTIGVFQCDSEGARRTLRQLQARTVRDMAVANAFFKPGPATGGMARTFVRRYRGQEPVRFLHPSLAPILQPTQGVLIFQEQILRVAREVAGLSWAQADQLRRGMSHFGRREMADMQAQFIAGCQRPPPEGPGFGRRTAETLWEQVQAFAGYGFNQGHATAYAMLSYRSAYILTHWPAAFLCARLAEWGGYHHPAIYQAEAVRLGLQIRPPHVNHSVRKFTLDWQGEQAVLWMGLGQIRDLRRRSVQSLIAERRKRSFIDLRDILTRVPLQTKELAHLIQAGGLDGLGSSRTSLLAQAQEIQDAGSALQMPLAFARPEVEREPVSQRLAWEQHLLGQPVSVHPLEIVRDQLPEVLRLKDLPAHTGKRVTVAAVRLPGWTGSRGFYAGDGQTFVVVKADPGKPSPKPWQPLIIRGRPQTDEWDTHWLQADSIEPVTQDMSF